MPERPKQHIIDEKAQSLLREILPDEWVLSKVDPDYGNDYFLDIYANGSFTGERAVIQLKGAETPKKSANGNYFARPKNKDA